METLPLRILPVSARRARLLTEANMRRYLRRWVLFATGFVEPLLFLLSIGIGLGGLVGGVDVGGQHVAYAAFVAPGLLANSAMTGAMIDSVFNVFFKLKITHSYDAVLATPLDPADVAGGEVLWAVVRGSIYSAAFIAVMVALGDASSPWVIACLPACMLLSASLASVGLAATSYMRTWQDFDLVTLVQMPMFLFAGVFYPITAYPTWLRGIVAATPLYQGVALCRGFALGHLSWSMALDVAYLVVLGVVGMVIAVRRLASLLVP
jgi:lipooligosaccharide transport system permease protein